MLEPPLPLCAACARVELRDGRTVETVEPDAVVAVA
jgi:hypothetical protein